MQAPLSLLDGFQLPLEGGRLLLREKRLWALAAAPIGFSLLAFAVAASLLASHAGSLYEWATLWMPAPEAASWVAWLWVGPAKAALATLGALIFALLAGVVLLIAFLVANVLASPLPPSAESPSVQTHSPTWSSSQLSKPLLPFSHRQADWLGSPQ